MPRKALAPERAALRFAQEADDERGAARPCRQGMRTLAVTRPGERPRSERLTRQALRSTTNFYEIVGYGARQTGPAWVSLRHVRKPVHCGSPQAACPSGNEVQLSAWSTYAPFTQGACRNRCGLEGVEFLERMPNHLGRRCDDRRWAMKPAERRARPAQRSSESTGEPEDEPAPADDSRSLKATGHKGEVNFFLQRVAGGLFVEREEIPKRGLRTVQSVHFNDPAAFHRWCEGDPVRFEHPMLHVSLKRDGEALWRTGTEPGCG